MSQLRTFRPGRSVPHSGTAITKQNEVSVGMIMARDASPVSPSTSSSTASSSFSESLESSSVRSAQSLVPEAVPLHATQTRINHDTTTTTTISTLPDRQDRTSSSKGQEDQEGDVTKTAKVVIVDLPPDLPSLMGSLAEKGRARLWSLRTRAAIDEQQRSPSIWNEDNISSAAVWSEEDSVDTGKEASQRMKRTDLAISEPLQSLIDDTRPQKRGLTRRLSRLCFRKSRGSTPNTCNDNHSNDRNQGNVETTIDAHSSVLVRHSPPSPQQLSTSTSPFLSRKRIIQARRSHLGFARTVTMDGILESFPEPTEQSSVNTSNGSTFVSTTPPRRQPWSSIAVPLDYTQILHDSIPGSRSLDRRRFEERDAPTMLVWV